MNFYYKLLDDFKKMSLGHSAIGISVSSCMGSIAAIFIPMSGHTLLYMFELFLVVSVCMGFNTVVIAQFKPKIILNTLLISLAVSTISIF